MLISKSFAWWISVVWLLCLLISVCAELTPLEFTPLSIGNPIHWIVWGLAFPASGLLQVQIKQLRQVWIFMPKLLWGGITSIQILWTVFILVYGYRHQQLRYFWRDAFEPSKHVFARRASWSANGKAEYRQGKSVVRRQGLWDPPYGFLTSRRVILAPIIPGLVWVTPISNDSILVKPWQVVDTTGQYLLRGTR
jgi:hypothetical protein